MSDVSTLAIAHRPSRPSALGYHAVTAVGAAVAAVTTALALAASLPAWAMFLGWVAFAGGGDARAGAAKIAAFLLGLPLGLGLDLASAAIAPMAPTLATPLAVFGTVLVVLTLRKLPWINDPLAYFLGIITVTVAAQSSAPSVPVLAVAALLGRSLVRRTAAITHPVLLTSPQPETRHEPVQRLDPRRRPDLVFAGPG